MRARLCSGRSDDPNTSSSSISPAISKRQQDLRNFLLDLWITISIKRLRIVSSLSTSERETSSQISLASAKLRLALGVEGFDAFAEIIRLAQATVTMSFKFDGDGQGRILRIVKKLFGRALRERRKAAQFVD